MSEKQPEDNKAGQENPQPQPQQLSREYRLQSIVEGHNLLVGYANDKANNPVMAHLIGTYLNHINVAYGLLRGLVNLHNDAVAIVIDAEETGRTVDLTPVQAKLAILANTTANEMGTFIHNIAVDINTEDGSITMGAALPPQEQQAVPPVPKTTAG